MEFFPRSRQIQMGIGAMFLLGLLLTGCASQDVKNIDITSAFKAPMSNAETGVILSPGDIIDIKFPYAGEFNETLTILPNGEIILPLAGEVTAAGKTPLELQQELFKSYSKHLQHPELAVIVRSFYERRVFVGGEVNRPGPVPLPGRLSVMDAIMEAGGLIKDNADVSSILVMRHQNGRKMVLVLDYEDVIEGQAADHPFYLQPQDVVFVPRTTIVNVDLWIRQHFWDLLPNVGVGYTFGQ